MADITFMLAVTLPFYLLAERSIYDQKKIISIRNSNLSGCISKCNHIFC